jgi:GNAT superfamily N-acetyltransferase
MISFKYLYEQQLLKENSNRYILLPYDEYNDDFDQYGIDMYEAEDEALKVAKNGSVTILRDKTLSAILIDSKISKVIGGLWISNEPEKFSFDIAIDSSYQNMGLSKHLINAAIQEYRTQKDMYDDMGEDFKMEVDVINPKLAQILKNKYGFHVTGHLSQNRVLMGLNENIENQDIEDFKNALSDLATLDLEDDQVRIPKFNEETDPFIFQIGNTYIHIRNRNEMPQSGPFELFILDIDDDVIGFIRGTKKK